MPVKAMLLTVAILFNDLSIAATDQAYITQKAINAYGSTFDKVITDELSKYRIIMLGEVHGTSEYPQFALDMVNNLKKAGKKVTLALEIPANFQTEIQAAIKEKDLGRLAKSDFFSSPFQDGRASLSMALLIMAASNDADVFCFDKSWTLEAKDRDLVMAKNVIQYTKQNPDRTVVLLAGNYHTSQEVQVAEPKFTPMGYYLSHMEQDAIDLAEIFSIRGRAEKGSNWVCLTSNPEECGVRQFDQGSTNYASANDWQRYFLMEPTLQDGHNATLFVRSTSATVPLKSELQELNNCKLSSQHLELLAGQEFWTFDQTPFGHRYLFQPSSSCKLASAGTIDSYLLTHQATLLPGYLRILYFHAGQDYAMGGAYSVAIARFSNSFNKAEPEMPKFHWNAYVSATIAFLKKDKAALIAARDKFPSIPLELDVKNLQVIERFIKCFDSNYYDAYNGSGTCAK